MSELKKDYTEEELIQLAEKRIKIKRELYSHIAAYVFVNAFLIGFYFMFSQNTFPWFVFPLGGWGLGLAFHIFGTIQELSFKYNANAINKEVEKIKKHLNKVDN